MQNDTVLPLHVINQLLSCGATAKDSHENCMRCRVELIRKVSVAARHCCASTCIIRLHGNVVLCLLAVGDPSSSAFVCVDVSQGLCSRPVKKSSQ
jgi:hypothetical protein